MSTLFCGLSNLAKSAEQQVLEKGHAYFFYRPKIDIGDRVKGANDVQRFFIVLVPEGNSVHPNNYKRKRDNTTQATDAKSPSNKRAKAEENIKAKQDAKSPKSSITSPKQKPENSKSPKQQAKSEPKSPRQHPKESVTSPKQKGKEEPKSPLKSASQTGQSSKNSARLIVVGAKRLPSIQSRSKCYAFVKDVSNDVAGLMHKHLDEYDYETKTRGTRHADAARLFGEARYEIIRMANGSTHFVYVLEVPTEVTEVEKAFGVVDEGSFLIQMKNPNADPVSTRTGQVFRALPKGVKAHLPDHIQNNAFVGKVKPTLKFAPLDPEALNYAFLELLLIGVDIKDENYNEELEKLEQDVLSEVEGLSEDERESKMLKELKTSHKQRPLATNEFK